MEHIEEAGIHSGDSSCSLPPYTLSDGILDGDQRRDDRGWPRSCGVVGLMNVQYAVQGARLYVLEVEPARVAHGAVRQQGDRACRSRSWRRKVMLG